ncbi:MAG: carboxy-S-adenosyl-L-methionine synthase CmoA [Alcanivorax sp.]|nr:carboxy-S-adenosyl-L-methionine synthase CmoA [Alcanivorax sp.]MAY11204.1 carboxy-S-adenosyl-L-methionine synthase CmoA [Alcanivorax sp.]MBI54388.1 carboxy-S-adenosyl-L-methionine synthase CmoA [Alcanivorax sp.]MBU60253.1 carboxy-S-adenosyl-L-methionine synthase CmoA [Alcanivorax sp.]HCE40984.1 carboxy-S-adenosyl-L-methionine synthase CmoA [Alcanivorax sp.]|tara:strand:+ start:16287 stop:17036 length:750 start_codon:yes stop_codon:yes gene_type:complete
MTANSKSSHKDRLFAEQEKAIGDFDFGEQTAAVFDDMLDRSIPQYGELQRMIGELAGELATPGSRVYDLGCSTGITLNSLYHAVAPDVELVGMDYSQAMLEKARANLAGPFEEGRLRFEHGDLNDGVRIENASVVVLNLTLQFVRPMNREALLRSVVDGLRPGGALILVEKVLGSDAFLNRLWIKLYYDMKKRNGYSETEIAQKREALENVLIPYRPDENIKILKRSGLDNVDMFFKWYNFAGFLGVKA